MYICVTGFCAEKFLCLYCAGTASHVLVKNNVFTDEAATVRTTHLKAVYSAIEIHGFNTYLATCETLLHDIILTLKVGA